MGGGVGGKRPFSPRRHQIPQPDRPVPRPAWGPANYTLVSVEGTLEIAPAIGYADLISDLVSSGITLRDNHLRPLDDGQILASQAALIANKQALQQRPEVLETARQLLEYIEAHLRAKESHIVTANIRGESPEAIAAAMFDQPHIGGLQGPTIARVVGREGLDNGLNWYAINIVVHKRPVRRHPRTAGHRRQRRDCGPLYLYF
jgi:ATP phosphoribosyltransferase